MIWETVLLKPRRVLQLVITFEEILSLIRRSPKLNIMKLNDFVTLEHIITYKESHDIFFKYYLQIHLVDNTEKNTAYKVALLRASTHVTIRISVPCSMEQ